MKVYIRHVIPKVEKKNILTPFALTYFSPARVQSRIEIGQDFKLETT